MGKKLAIVASVVVIGATVAFYFRKDAAPWGFWRAGADDPFEMQVERRVTSGPARAQQALRVAPSTTAAISQPRGLADEGQPTYSKNLNPVGALLPPIDGVVDDGELDAAGDASADPAPAAQAGVTRHTVVDGDTLSQLAARYLGRADAYLEIYELNRDVLASPDLLPIGAVLTIPERRANAGPFAAEGPRDLVPVPGRP